MAKANPNTQTEIEAFALMLREETFSVTLGKRDGNPTTVAIPVGEFPANALMAMFAYGVQRKFNDAVGGSDKTVDDKVNAVNAMIADYREGKVARARATGESVDPILAEVRMLLRPDVKAAYVATHDTGAWKALSEEEINKMLDLAYADQSAEVQNAIDAQAQANLDAKEAMRKAKAGLSGKIKLNVA